MSCVADREAHAETIDFTFTGPSFSFTFDPSSGTVFNPTTMTWGASYSSADLMLLNSVLGADGSAYTFSSLGGENNWAGATSGGILSLSGLAVLGSSGTKALTVTETTSGFISPSAPRRRNPDKLGLGHLR